MQYIHHFYITIGYKIHISLIVFNPHKQYYPTDCLLSSLCLVLPSKRRLFTVWGSKPRLYAWHGARLPWLSIQPTAKRESQRRMRFVDLQRVVIHSRQRVERSFQLMLVEIYTLNCNLPMWYTQKTQDGAIALKNVIEKINSWAISL